MKFKSLRGVVLVLVMGLVLLLITGSTVAEIDPSSISVTLRPGESFTETKTVRLPAIIPNGDIVFAFDLTGSMGDEIGVAKAEALNIMNALDALISDARYGVVSYMDYPEYYSSCDYSDEYGDPASGDYAYSLDQPLTDDKVLVTSVINSLVLGYGGDGPQDYTRVFYESYSDPAIGYRPGSKKILLNFGDAVPHDCDINEGVPGAVGTWSTGIDPGRDEILYTADDLDLQTVLADMAGNNVTLLEIHGNTYYGDLAHWEHWTGLTGGALYHLGGAGEVPEAIESLIEGEATFLSMLTLEVTTPGYESWLTSVTPPSYADLELPTEVTFDVVVTVPEDAAPGIHVFFISAIGDGASYGDQEVTVEVRDTRDVFVDIKPQSCPNPLNVKGSRDEEIDSRTAFKIDPTDTPLDRAAVFPVAILGTHDFDVRQIDPCTILLAGVPALRWNYEDVSTPMPEDAEECECHTDGADGFEDMTLKFDKASIIAALGAVEDGDLIPLVLTGEMFDGTPIEGSDCVLIRGDRSGALMSSSDDIHDLKFELEGNYPNPFNPMTSICFTLNEECDVTLDIYNILGQRIVTLVDRRMEAGRHSVSWHSDNAASGVYFYRLTAGDFTKTKKMMLLR